MSWKPQGFKNGETYCVAPIVLGKAQIGVGRKELWLIALWLMSIGRILQSVHQKLSLGNLIMSR